MGENTFIILSSEDEPSFLYGSMFPNVCIQARCLEDDRIVTVYIDCSLAKNREYIKKQLLDSHSRDILSEERMMIPDIKKGDIL